jgi:LacI family transcriptional regulator
VFTGHRGNSHLTVAGRDAESYVAVTITDIARRANVSAATVSRVLSGKDELISAPTRERVRTTAIEMGYQRNRAALSLVTGKTQVVALWIRNPDAPYYARMIRSIEECAANDGYELIVRGFHQRAECNREVIIRRQPDAGLWPVDGIFAADCRLVAADYCAAREHGRRTAAPLIGLGSDFPCDAEFVGIDHVLGVEAAVQHLIDVGCRRIVHLSAHLSILCVQAARAQAYERVMHRAGLSPEVIMGANESRPAARAALQQRLRSGPPFDGVFALNDDVAIGGYRALRDAGRRVPEDCRIAGCDGIVDTEFLDTPLTTVLQPVEEMCRIAWATLKRRLSNPAAPLQQLLLPATLLIRDSTGGAPRAAGGGRPVEPAIAPAPVAAV